MSGGAAPKRSGVLVRAQMLCAAEWVENAGKTLEALEREDTEGRAAREA